MELNMDTLYDVLVIGGGPAGLNAAIYSRRKGAKVGIIGNELGGQVKDTSSVENYLGFPSISGVGLVEEFLNHVKELDIPTRAFVEVVKIKADDSECVKEVHLKNGDVYKTLSIIIATGSKPRKLNVPGELEFAGKGVAYCAICDGPMFEDRDVIVAGGGNSAVEAAIDLAKIANKVKLVHRSEFRADKILIDRLEALDNVEIYLNTQIEEIFGEKLVKGVRAIDRSTGEAVEISSNGVFVEIGYTPNSDIFKDSLELNRRNEIVTDKYGRTNVRGVYAAGDVSDAPYKQIIVAASEGAICALTANDYLNKME